MANRTSRDVLVRGLRIIGVAIREQRRLFLVAFVGSSLFAVLTVGGAYVVGAVVGQVVVPAVSSGEVDAAALALGAAALVGLSLAKILSVFGRRLGAGYMQYALQATYRRRVTRRYLQLPVAWHHQHATGTLLSNANSDVEAAWYPIAPLPFACGTLVMLVAALAALFSTDWVLGLIGLALFASLSGLNLVYSRRMAPRQMRAQQLRAEVSAIAHESFDGALLVKTMGREAEETARFAGRTGELRDALISVGRLRGSFEPMLDTLPSLGTLAALLVGAWRLRQGAVSVTEVVSVCYLFTIMAMPIRAIGWVVAEIPRSVAGWDRLQRVLTATGEMPYGGRELDPDGSSAATLRFDHVSFSYGDTQVLHDVSFTVPAGRTVALVGRTGSGKSTIASLAVRLVDPQRGTVTLDGVDVRELSAQSLARNVALVPQVPFAFDDTVRANVSLDRRAGRGATADRSVIDDAEVWAALRLAQADGFVARLPDGLDTELGERGTTLSGGQRQRLTLARALAGRPRLLVLDDATSAVDPRVEAAILSGLREAAAASILVVAYRRATIALADEVVFVEHGRVAARGSHAELLATMPAYADLVTAYERAEAERERERAYDETEVSA
ncbi:MAG: ABC transporter ATP-binding protein [Micromonosporaceae bacterium]|nr:ABC transporter ATP-binding protein [Micromonosporaceae bacterium]